MMAQQKLIWLVSIRVQVWSLTSLSGLRIWHSHELWCRVHTWLGSHIIVAVASGYSSDLTTCLGTSICRRCGPKKTKKKKITSHFPLIHLPKYTELTHQAWYKLGVLQTASHVERESENWCCCQVGVLSQRISNNLIAEQRVMLVRKHIFVV